MSKIRLMPINDHNRQLLMIRVKDIIRLEQNVMPSKNEFPTRIIYKVGGKERVALVSTTINDTVQCVANTKEI